MVDRSLIALKVRSYLEGLSGPALAMLVRGLEAGHENGSRDPQSGVILEAARSLIRSPETDNEPDAFRRGLLKRAFFEPLEPFLITEVLSTKLSGRIHRPSLDAIWLWMERDLAPKKITELQKTLIEKDFEEPAVEAAALALRAEVLGEMRQTLDEANAGGLGHQKVAFRIGGDDILAELEDIHGLLSIADDLKFCVDQLPDTLDAVDLKTDELLLTQAKAFVGSDQRRGSWLAALYLVRAEDPAWLVSFAARAARSTKANLIHRSPYRPFIQILLSELQRLTLEAKNARGNPAQGSHMVDCVQRFSDLVHDIDIETNLEDVAEWRKQMAADKAEMATFLGTMLKGVSKDVRSAIQVPDVGEDGRFTQNLDAIENTRQSLRVLLIARHRGDALAINEPATRVFHTVEQILDIGTRTLLDNVRDGTGDRRRASLSSLNVAISYCEVFFGQDHARMLRNRRNKLSDAIDLATFDADGLFADGQAASSPAAR